LNSKPDTQDKPNLFKLTKQRQQREEKPEGKPEQKPRKKSKGYGFAALGLLAGLLGLIASRLGQLWIAFDVFAQFTLQFVFLTMAFAMAMLVPRFKVLAGVVFFVMMLVGYGSWPSLNAGKAASVIAAEPGRKLLRVASFNSHLINTEQDAQIKSIRDMAADVVILLEAGPEKRPIFDALKAEYPHQFDCNVNQHCKMAILSKTPLSETGFRVQWEGPPHIRASLGPDYGNVTLVGVHTIRFPYSRAQMKQANALVKELESITSGIIMTGDFNATPYSRIIKTIADGTGMIRHTNLPTWPAWVSLPQLAIDHMFTSPQITAASGQGIGDAANSDHLPITMVFSVPVK
jgi:endonuclease/exonuclease/phosphatase (EEP) superfamily protein YafD